jgi:hypothetical protein
MTYLDMHAVFLDELKSFTRTEAMEYCGQDPMDVPMDAPWAFEINKITMYINKLVSMSSNGSNKL